MPDTLSKYVEKLYERTWDLSWDNRVNASVSQLTMCFLMIEFCEDACGKYQELSQLKKEILKEIQKFMSFKYAKGDDRLLKKEYMQNRVDEFMKSVLNFTDKKQKEKEMEEARKIVESIRKDERERIKREKEIEKEQTPYIG